MSQLNYFKDIFIDVGVVFANSVPDLQHYLEICSLLIN